MENKLWRSNYIKGNNRQWRSSIWTNWIWYLYVIGTRDQLFSIYFIIMISDFKVIHVRETINKFTLFPDHWFQLGIYSSLAKLKLYKWADYGGWSHSCLFFELIKTRLVIKLQSKLSLYFYSLSYRPQTQQATCMHVKKAAVNTMDELFSVMFVIDHLSRSSIWSRR